MDRRPVRIMHVIDSLGKGGLENGLVNLIHRLDANRFEHVVCAIRSLGPNAERLPADRIRVMCLGKQDSDPRVQILSLIRAIRGIQPDIVHSRNWGAIEAVIAGRCVRSCATVHSEHGLDSNAAAREPRRRTWFRRAAFEAASRVISVSKELRDVHAARTGFPAHRITVVHNGVDSTQFFPDPNKRRRVRGELKIRDHEYCIGAVGSLFPIKDHITLLEAANQIAELCSDWCLLLVGEGPERQALQAFVNDHPELSKRVQFLGLSTQIPDLLNAMDVYALPSISEGICNSLLEAMATGVPVIATHTGGNPEVVTDGDTGLLFPVRNARALAAHLGALMSNQAERARLGERAREHVFREFSIDSMVRKYEQIYEGLKPAVMRPVQVTARA